MNDISCNQRRQHQPVLQGEARATKSNRLRAAQTKAHCHRELNPFRSFTQAHLFILTVGMTDGT
jgi:hypothetical protein